MIKYYKDIQQGSPEWFAIRCGILSASEMKLVFNIPKEETRIKKNGEPYKQREMGFADNDDCRSHAYELAVQRVTKYVDPTFPTYAMQRGKEDEVEARILYNANYAPVEDCGFVINDEFGFQLGYSPDGLIGDPGLIETKSRKQKLQMETLLECIALNKVPDEHVIQVQTGLLVTRREWLDYNTFCGGFYMATIRVMPDLKIQAAIIDAARQFETTVIDCVHRFEALKKSNVLMLETERRVDEEMAA